MARSKSIISQTEFAQLCGLTKQAITKAMKVKSVKIVTIKGMKKIDFGHKVTQLYYQNQLAKLSLKNKPAPPASKGDSGEDGEIISLQAQKTIEEIGKIKADRRLKELKLDFEKGKLIDKETLGAVLFQYIDALNINMLDIPDMLIDVLIDKVKAGSSRGDMIKHMRDYIQGKIVSTKTQIKERMK